MNRLTSRGVSGSFRTLLTLVLMVLGARFAQARVGSARGVAQQPGALTYTATVLHTFEFTDGSEPQAGLVADSAGNLYGTTTVGGSGHVGTVFELSPDGQGGWTYNEIYTGVGGVGIAIDNRDNLYISVDIAAGGIVELSPGPNGTWVESNSYGFTGTYDGSDPVAPVIFDANGNVYGTALNGGGYGVGTVFELVPVGNQWLERTLHTFTGGLDGAYPEGSLIMDREGNLYGTTSGGGTGYQRGVVFKLHPTASGWKETVLYSFSGGATDGANPTGNLIFDRAGNLYGTTAGGFNSVPGQYGTGGVYQLTPKGLITWLYQFTGGADGGTPGNGLAFDPEGNLYGTTVFGGDTTDNYCSDGVGGCGVVYELTPSNSNGTTAWTESVLHSFTSGSDGDSSSATPYLDLAGNVYVTSFGGGDTYGSHGDGTVLEMKPDPDPTAVTITKNAPSPSATGRVVTVSFAVSQSVNIGSKPTGTVTVNASTGEACLAALPANGKSGCQLVFLSAGTRTLTATYSGDARNQGCTSIGVTQSIVNPTVTSITKNRPDPAKIGKTVLVEFGVDAKDATRKTRPTGSVTVNASTGESCSGTLSAGGSGRCELTFSTAGSRTLTATYSGDGDNEGSISRATEETVE